jgi:hypothetical protein
MASAYHSVFDERQGADSRPTRPDAPRIPLAAAEGEDHLLGLALVDLVAREQGWRSSWSGGA